MDDHGLLREFVQSRSEAAFGKLVERHLRMVYAVACRIVGDSHLAEEVVQNVFTTLAQKAPTLGRRQVVAGWLWHTTRHLALHTVRAEHRRRARELAAVTMQTPDQNEETPEHVLAQLESALAELDPADHEALVLRHLENRSLRDVGRELGISEDAARMRVNRALEKLRAVFTAKGIKVSSALLLTVLAGSTAKAVPLGLALVITSTAFAAARASLSAGAAASTAKWVSLKPAALVAATLVLGSAAVLVELFQPTQPSHVTPTVAASTTGSPTAPVLENLPNPAAAASIPTIWESSSTSVPAPEVQSLLKRAITLLATKQCVEARTLLDETIGLKPDFAEAYFYRGKAFTGLGQLVAATENYTRAIERQPTMFLAWHERASLHEQLQEFTMAIFDCDQAIKLNASFWQTWLVRGRAKYRQHLDTEARHDLERVLELQPDCDEARQLLAKIPLTIPDGVAPRDLNYSLGQFDEASHDFGRALHSGDHSANTVLLAGLNAIQSGKDESSLQFYIEAEKLNPGGPDRFELRGLAYANLSRWSDAVADYTQAIRRHSQIGRLYFYRSVAEARLEQMDAALADALKALAAKDLDPQPRLQLTLLAQGWLRERGRSQEARNWLRQPKIDAAAGWAGSVVRFLRGDLTWDQLQRTAGNDTERSEGFAYAGWVDLLDGRVEVGRVKLQWMLDHGDKKAPRIRPRPPPPRRVVIMRATPKSPPPLRNKFQPVFRSSFPSRMPRRYKHPCAL